MLTFDLLAICIEHDTGVSLVLFPKDGLPESYFEAARESIVKQKNVVFPRWKDKPVDEGINKLSLKAESAASAERSKISSVLLHKIEGVPNGFIQVFSHRKDAFDEKQEFVLGVLAYWLVSYFALSRIYDRLEALAVTDPLTGVFNRRKFEEELEREIERSKRYNLDFVAMMMDVDDLKGINDTFGHYAGDMTLKRCAKLLVSKLRKVDTVTRIGGDEFFVILPHTKAEGAKIVAERLIQAMKGPPLEMEGRDVASSMTISITSFYHDDTFESLYRRVDAGLNEAKASCKGFYYIVEKI